MKRLNNMDEDWIELKSKKSIGKVIENRFEKSAKIIDEELSQSLNSKQLLEITLQRVFYFLIILTLNEYIIEVIQSSRNAEYTETTIDWRLSLSLILSFFLFILALYLILPMYRENIRKFVNRSFKLRSLLSDFLYIWFGWTFSILFVYTLFNVNSLIINDHIIYEWKFIIDRAYSLLVVFIIVLVLWGLIKLYLGLKGNKKGN